MWKSTGRFIGVALVAGILLCISWNWQAPAVYADGGAPQLAYVAGGEQGISVIDIAQRRRISNLTVTGQPRMVLLSPDGAALYVTQPELGRVDVLAARSGQTICSARLPGQPSLLALSIDAAVLYVAGQGDTRVSALNPATCALERTFETRSPVYGLAVAASTAANATPSTPNQIWAAGDSGLTVFEATGRFLGAVLIAAGPQALSIPAGFTAYVTTRQGSVLAVDLDSRRVIRTLISGGEYGQMDYDATTGEIYVPDRLHDLLDVLTPITASGAQQLREPARQLQLGGVPQSIAITSDGQLGFAALADGRVLMLDIPGRSILTSISVGGTPRFIITGLYPPAASTVPSTLATSTTPFSGLWQMFVVLGVVLIALLLGGGWFFWSRTRQGV